MPLPGVFLLLARFWDPKPSVSRETSFDFRVFGRLVIDPQKIILFSDFCKISRLVYANLEGTRISFAVTGAAIPTTATTFGHRQCGTEATSGITANSASSKHLLHVEFAKQNTLSMSA